MTASFHEERPIYLQVADMLCDAILSGAYAEEQQIPSITEISVAYKINPATALKGVTMLVEKNLLYKKRGLGMFVAAGARERLIAVRKEGFYQAYTVPMVLEAKHLRMRLEELGEMIERGWMENGNRD